MTVVFIRRKNLDTDMYKGTTGWRNRKDDHLQAIGRGLRRNQPRWYLDLIRLASKTKKIHFSQSVALLWLPQQTNTGSLNAHFSWEAFVYPNFTDKVAWSRHLLWRPPNSFSYRHISFPSQCWNLLSFDCWHLSFEHLRLLGSSISIDRFSHCLSLVLPKCRS